MITKQQAMTCTEFTHVSLLNTDKTPVRCRAIGKCKTWKTRPDDFKLPVKYGLRKSFYITNDNAVDWNAADSEQLKQVWLRAWIALKDKVHFTY